MDDAATTHVNSNIIQFDIRVIALPQIRDSSQIASNDWSRPLHASFTRVWMKNMVLGYTVVADLVHQLEIWLSLLLLLLLQGSCTAPIAAGY